MKPRPPALSGRRSAFTLIELLVVVAIIGVLAGIMIAVTFRVRESAAQVACTSNLRSLYQSIVLYTQNNRKLLPNPNVDDAGNHWLKLVMPYFTDLPEGTSSTRATEPARCPAHARRIEQVTGKWFAWNYGMNAALGATVGTAYQPRRLDSLPRPSQTLLLTEGGYNANSAVAQLNRHWLINGATFNGRLGGPHHDANNILWADGHVSAWRDYDALNVDIASAADRHYAPGFNPREP